ncbi:hypothetical protein APA_2118 [Pseudanabaena sp. lw0831]|uniref:YtxH domain-containing protein n=1 Tax=Pseudanabaena sp. lw0831 TaxID=1357935 RepID=UPI0019156936|nr:YtxH domain-containing protein [Pseudanabaena sp. lw0831]GBO54170.1 hypothetical protein APA_2118 [Pseudanabaena sp. lw0831]
MTNILDSGNASNFNNPVTAVLNGVKKGLLFAFGFALVLMLQVTFFSSGAIASPLASIGNPTIADTSKDFAKEAGNRAKDLAKNVKEGTKENMGKAKDMAKDAKNKVGDGVERTKAMAGDRANEVKANTKDLSDKAGNKVEEAIDSVKNFLGQ